MPSDRDPRTVVEAFLAAMAELDYDTALTHVTDDVVYTNMPLGPVEGPGGIRAVLEPFFAPTVTNEWVVSSVAVHDDVVFVERLDRHQLPGGWVELPVVGVFEVRDGRIAAWRDYFDLATLQRGFAGAGQPIG